MKLLVARDPAKLTMACCVVATFLIAPSHAQENETTAPAIVTAEGEQAVSSEDIDALIQRVEEQIQRMNEASSERDKALEFLEEQIDKATNQISEKEETEDALRQRTIELDSEIELLAKDRTELSSEVETREQALQRLNDEVSKLEALLEGEKLTRSQEIAALNAAIDEEKQVHAKTVAELESLLDGERDRVAAAQAAMNRVRAEHADEVEAYRSRLDGLEQTNTANEEDLRFSRVRIDQLTRQVQDLVDKLSFVQISLSASEAKINDQGGKIEQLNAQLAEALQAQVEELEKYRSDFFGELSKILGDSQDINIVGDRFVLPSSLFFASGTALLSQSAQDQLREVASTLRTITTKIPPTIRWILRVDGHTDNEPLKPGSYFQSNWELSSQRAIEVVKFLIESGIDPKRLAATGFGEHQPIDPFDKSRNRRIEFKLTEG